MPRRKTPAHLKLIQGTTRKDRAGTGADPDLLLLERLPDPPAWLTDPVAIAEWHRLAGILTACRILPAGALSALGVLCALHAELVKGFRAGETPKAALIGQYRGLCNDFAIPPAAQGKIKAPPPPMRENRFAANGRGPDY